MYQVVCLGGRYVWRWFSEKEDRFVTFFASSEDLRVLGSDDDILIIGNDEKVYLFQTNANMAMLAGAPLKVEILMSGIGYSRVAVANLSLPGAPKKHYVFFQNTKLYVCRCYELKDNVFYAETMAGRKFRIYWKECSDSDSGIPCEPHLELKFE